MFLVYQVASVPDLFFFQLLHNCWVQLGEYLAISGQGCHSSQFFVWLDQAEENNLKITDGKSVKIAVEAGSGSRYGNIKFKTLVRSLI